MDSLAQLPKSISLQRSEQNGRWRLVDDQDTGLRQFGQGTIRAGSLLIGVGGAEIVLVQILDPGVKAVQIRVIDDHVICFFEAV